LPASRAAGTYEDIRELVRLELSSDAEAVGQLAKPLSTAEEASDGPFSTDAFLRQTPLHAAVVSARPSQLPRLHVPWHESMGHGTHALIKSTKASASAKAAAGLLSAAKLARMLNREDSLGFNPLQRANSMHEQSALPRHGPAARAIAAIAACAHGRVRGGCGRYAQG
jgi:hypothetical protein